MQHPRLSVDAVVLAFGRHQSRETGVADDDALGLAGGTGGIDDIGRMSLVERTHPVGVGDRVFRAVGEPSGDHRIVEFDPVHRRTQHRAVGLGGESDGRAGIRQDVRDPVRRIGRIHRYVGRSGLRDGPDRQHRFDAAGDADGDDVTGADAAFDEFTGQTRGVRVHLAVGEFDVVLAHGHRIGGGLDRGGQQLTEGGAARPAATTRTASTAGSIHSGVITSRVQLGRTAVLSIGPTPWIVILGQRGPSNHIGRPGHRHPADI